jgi:hypothetical protein
MKDPVSINCVASRIVKSDRVLRQRPQEGNPNLRRRALKRLRAA